MEAYGSTAGGVGDGEGVAGVQEVNAAPVNRAPMLIHVRRATPSLLPN
jgi:hypothetical protein